MSLPNERFKVFLSHSEKDKRLTRRICETLDRLHIRTFVYELYPQGGANRFERIKAMIRESPFFVVALTKDGLESQWVNQEIGYAVGVGKTPIPILEVHSETKERLKSRGFVEINDPILYDPEDLDDTIGALVHTMYSWLVDQGKWAGRIWLTCECGLEFDAELDYGTWPSETDMLSWKCKCGRSVSIELPGFKQCP